jgi:hypothetical protein
MRRAARLAHRAARLEERKARRHPTVAGDGKTPQSRVPVHDEATGGLASGPDGPALLLLNELRAILEPLLTTGPLEVLSMDGEESW